MPLEKFLFVLAVVNTMMVLLWLDILINCDMVKGEGLRRMTVLFLLSVIVATASWTKVLL